MSNVPAYVSTYYFVPCFVLKVNNIVCIMNDLFLFLILNLLTGALILTSHLSNYSVTGFIKSTAIEK